MAELEPAAAGLQVVAWLAPGWSDREVAAALRRRVTSEVAPGGSRTSRVELVGQSPSRIFGGFTRLRDSAMAASRSRTSANDSFEDWGSPLSTTCGRGAPPYPISRVITPGRPQAPVREIQKRWTGIGRSGLPSDSLRAGTARAPGRWP